MSQALRNFALELLDDDHGINSQAWKTLADMLDDDEHTDIIDAVKAQDSRYYIGPDTAQLLREVKPKDT